MKDNYGDTVTVYVEQDHEEPSVCIDVQDCVQLVTHVYTAAKARKLARKLNAAADEIDPRPEPTYQSAATPALRECEREYLAAYTPAVDEDRSRGYQDGDTVLFTDIGAVLRYDAGDNAWYSAGPESHDCSNEFNLAEPGTVQLLARNGEKYDALAAMLRRHIRAIGGGAA